MTFIQNKTKTITCFFDKQHFYKTEIGKKDKQKLSNILRLNFCYLKIIRFLHLRITSSPKNNRRYSKKYSYKKQVRLLVGLYD